MKLMKVALVLVLAYQLYIAEIFSPIPYFLMFSYLLLDISLFVHWYSRKKRRKYVIAYECKAIIAFYITSLIFGLLLSVNTSIFLKNIFIGIEYAALFVAVYFVVMEEKSPKFIMKLLYIIAVTFIITSLLKGNLIYGRLVISSTSNANTLGNMCFLGASIPLYLFNKGRLGLLLSLLSIALSTYAAILSGSKKAVIVIILFLFIFIILRFKGWITKHPFKTLSVLCILCMAIFSKWSEINQFWVSSIIYERILNSAEIDIDRIELYNDAYRIFKEYPIFGVGYQNYTYYSAYGLYAHSAYMETLASTGIVGMIIWMSSYAVAVRKSIKNIIYSLYQESAIWVFVWLLCQLFLEFSSVSYYSPANFAMLGCIAALNMINRKSERKI